MYVQKIWCGHGPIGALATRMNKTSYFV